MPEDRLKDENDPALYVGVPNFCRSCGDPIDVDWDPSYRGKWNPTERCMTCHRELAYGRMPALHKALKKSGGARPAAKFRPPEA